MKQPQASSGNGKHDATRAIAFMHIPKTSGTALTQLFRQVLQPRLMVFGFDQSLFGGFKAFDTVSQDLRRYIYPGAPLPVDGADFITGHMAYSTLAQSCATAELVTVLREPLSRLLSHWLYWRAFSDDQLQPWAGWGDYVRQARRPLTAFLAHRDTACQTDNLIVRMLLWQDRRIPHDDFIDTKNDNSLTYDAIERLQNFAFVDILENPEFVANLEAWLDQSLTYPRVNEITLVPLALRSPLHKELTLEALDLLEERTRLDCQLWLWLAQQKIPAQHVDGLMRHTFSRNIARFAELMVG